MSDYSITLNLKRVCGVLLAVFVITLQVAHLQAQVLGTTTLIPEGACAATGNATIDMLCANSADHAITFSFNNGALENIPQTFYTSATYTNSNSAFSTVTGLTFPISASRNYHAICRVIWRASAATAGPKYQITGPIGATAINLALTSPTSITAVTSSSANTYTTAVANTQSIADTSQTFTDILDIAVLNGANAGTVALQAQAAGTGTLTINPASTCTVQ